MEEYEISGKTTKIKVEYIEEGELCKIELYIESDEEIQKCNFLFEMRDATKLSLIIAAVANHHKGEQYLSEIYEELKSEKIKN